MINEIFDYKDHNLWKKNNQKRNLSIKDKWKITKQQSLTLQQWWEHAHDSKKKKTLSEEEGEEKEVNRPADWEMKSWRRRDVSRIWLWRLGRVFLPLPQSDGRTDRQTVNLTQSRPARGCYFHWCNYGNSVVPGGVVAVPRSPAADLLLPSFGCRGVQKLGIHRW